MIHILVFLGSQELKYESEGVNNRKQVSIRVSYIYKHLAYSESIFTPSMINSSPSSYSSKRIPDYHSGLVHKGHPKIGFWNTKTRHHEDPHYLRKKKIMLSVPG